MSTISMRNGFYGQANAGFRHQSGLSTLLRKGTNNSFDQFTVENNAKVSITVIIFDLDLDTENDNKSPSLTKSLTTASLVTTIDIDCNHKDIS
jgi:hypothetical protein